MKKLGAWLIAYGIGALALGLMGLHFRLLFILDEFGPVWAYILKFGLIVLGIWIWRRDGMVTPDENYTDEESKRAWIPVYIGGTVIIGIITFIVINEIKRPRNVTLLPPPAATWSGQPVRTWPTFVLEQNATFQHHTDLHARSACLVRLPTGEIAAFSAGHQLGPDGGVEPGFLDADSGNLDRQMLAKLDTEIKSWDLSLPIPAGETNVLSDKIQVAGLYGDAALWDEHCDEVLLRLKPGQTNFPATPLDLRLTPLTFKEKLKVVTNSRDSQGNIRQVVQSAQSMPGLVFRCSLDHPVDTDNLAGALVLDRDGLLVGIITSTMTSTVKTDDSKNTIEHCYGHLATELLPVLQRALQKQGTIQLSPIKPVALLQVQAGEDTERQVARNPL